MHSNHSVLSLGKAYPRLFVIALLLFLAWASTNAQRVVLQMNNDWAFHRGDVADGAAPTLDDSHWTAATVAGTDAISSCRKATATSAWL